MQRHRDGEISDLVRDTIIWIAVVIWLVWGYVVQTPPADPYADATRNAFTVILAIVVSLVSAVVVLAWFGALRNRRNR